MFKLMYIIIIVTNYIKFKLFNFKILYAIIQWYFIAMVIQVILQIERTSQNVWVDACSIDIPYYIQLV